MEEQNVKEMALLVAVAHSSHFGMESLDELAELTETAGAEATSRVIQYLPHPNKATYVGSGKVKELVDMVEELELNLVIMNDSLSPVQLSNLGKLFPCRVVDRTQLILDIFAQRALSREGRLQVELAQLSYMMPRLAGSARQLSRLGGGIGTRGPGETKLESDRRHLRVRIAALQDEIEQLRKQRLEQRKGRRRDSLPQAALIGYTNAGKSTLMNYMTGSDLLVEDKLFATLDTTTRRLLLPDGRYALLADTVGFIRRLPTHLIAAFKATLEELQDADLLLHVVDISDEDYEERMAAVQSVLDELGNNRPLLMVFNKADVACSNVVESLLHTYPGSVAISAKDGDGIEALHNRMQELLYPSRTRYCVLLPYAESALLEPIYASAKILRREDNEQGMTLELESDARLAGRLERFRIAEEGAKWTAVIGNL